MSIKPQVRHIHPVPGDSFGVGACDVQGAGTDKAEEVQNDFNTVMGLFKQRVFQDDEAGKTYLPDDQLPDTLRLILEHAKSNYQPFAMASIQAAMRAEKTFELDLGYGEFTARSMKRLDKARLHVRDEIQDLALGDSLLENLGVLALYQEERL